MSNKNRLTIWMPTFALVSTRFSPQNKNSSLSKCDRVAPVDLADQVGPADRATAAIVRKDAAHLNAARVARPVARSDPPMAIRRNIA